MPPPCRVGLAREQHQCLALGVVVDPVQGEQIDDVALLEPDPPQLHPADLGLRGPDAVARVLAGDALGLTQPAQLGAEQYSAYGRAAARLNRDHIGPPGTPRSGWYPPAVLLHVRRTVSFARASGLASASYMGDDNVCSPDTREATS